MLRHHRMAVNQPAETRSSEADISGAIVDLLVEASLAGRESVRREADRLRRRVGGIGAERSVASAGRRRRRVDAPVTRLAGSNRRDRVESQDSDHKESPAI